MMIMAHLCSANNAAINDIHNYRLRRIYIRKVTHTRVHPLLGGGGGDAHPLFSQIGGGGGGGELKLKEQVVIKEENVNSLNTVFVFTPIPFLTTVETKTVFGEWSFSHRVQELCESRGGRPGLSVLTSLLVSVDIKSYWTVLRHWSQLVPNMSTDIWGH